MRICDGCKIPIPFGTNDYIEVTFHGKYGELVTKLHGANHLDFCSLECYDKLRIGAIKK